MKKFPGNLLLLFLCFAASQALAQSNVLTARTQNLVAYEAFIDTALLVIEPHGAYIEQTLYVDYSDHGRFGSSDEVEISHTFTLPADAVVKDLWLYFDDGIIQADIIDTWTARDIYDSNMVKKKSPAILTKTDGQYKLMVYPLTSNEPRRARIQYLTPCTWSGSSGSVRLPLRMLQANNDGELKLTILYREKAAVWGEPLINTNGNSALIFSHEAKGYKYYKTEIENIHNVNNATFEYSPEFEDGVYYSYTQQENDSLHFQFVLDPSRFARGAETDTTRYLIGLDLSSRHTGMFSSVDELLDKVSASLKNLEPGYSEYKMLVTGGTELLHLNTEWQPLNQVSINGSFARLRSSALYDSVTSRQYDLRAVALSDTMGHHHFSYWQMYGTCNFYTKRNLLTTLREMEDWMEVVVTGEYGHYHTNPVLMDEIKGHLDKLLQKENSRLLMYTGDDIKNEDWLVHEYIDGFEITFRRNSRATYYGNENGVVGPYLPKQIDRGRTCFMTWDDPDVVPELYDADGNVCVISKKVGNGYVVVSSMYTYTDDGSMREITGKALIGTFGRPSDGQLPQLATSMASEHSRHPADYAILYSTDDAPRNDNDIPGLTLDAMPPFVTMNLLNDTDYDPPVVYKNGNNYLGSGYMLESLAEMTGGTYFSLRDNSLEDLEDVILQRTGLQNYTFKEIQVTADEGNGESYEIREIGQDQFNLLKPLFFIGSAEARSTIQFDFTVDFSDDTWSDSFTSYLIRDTLKVDNAVRPMLASEHLNDMFTNSPEDTAAIVALAMEHRLLTDYTAFLVKTPDDTTDYLQNPDDDSDGPATSIEDEQWSEQADSLFIAAHPNPFNSQTSVTVSIPSRSDVVIKVYNVLGQEIATIAEEYGVLGRKTYRWHGLDAFNRPVSSGIYFIVAHIIDNDTRQATVRSVKVMLLK